MPDDQAIKPHSIRDELARRDPDFDRKRPAVLMVYRDIAVYAEGAVDAGRPNPIDTVSVDEKLGVQAIGLVAPDVPPMSGQTCAPAYGPGGDPS